MLTKPFWAFCPPGPATVSHKAPWAHPAGSGPPPPKQTSRKNQETSKRNPFFGEWSLQNPHLGV